MTPAEKLEPCPLPEIMPNDVWAKVPPNISTADAQRIYTATRDALMRRPAAQPVGEELEPLPNAQELAIKIMVMIGGQAISAHDASRLAYELLNRYGRPPSPPLRPLPEKMPDWFAGMVIDGNRAVDIWSELRSRFCLPAADRDAVLEIVEAAKLWRVTQLDIPMGGITIDMLNAAQTYRNKLIAAVDALKSKSPTPASGERA